MFFVHYLMIVERGMQKGSCIGEHNELKRAAKIKTDRTLVVCFYFVFGDQNDNSCKSHFIAECSRARISITSL